MHVANSQPSLPYGSFSRSRAGYVNSCNSSELTNCIHNLYVVHTPYTLKASLIIAIPAPYSIADYG